jgi:transposase-like protein
LDLWKENEMVANRRYNRSFKISVCEAVLLGTKSKAQTCREHGLTPSMLDRWVDQYRKLGKDAFPNSAGPGEVSAAQRMRELEALVGRLTLENEILKSALEKGASGLGPESG